MNSPGEYVSGLSSAASERFKLFDKPVTRSQNDRLITKNGSSMLLLM